MKTQSNPRMMTTSQTARALGLSSERVRQLANSGRLACTDSPLGRLFAPEVVEAFRRERTPAAESTATVEP